MTIDVLKAIPDTKRSLLLPNLARSRKQVRRCLFGAVDHNESMRFLQNELNSIQESQSRRWNFDFHDEKPINSSNGIYEWEPVQPTDDIPKAYALGRLSFLGANSSDVKESDSSVDACHGGCEQSPEVSTRLQATESAPKMVTTKSSVQRSMKGKRSALIYEFRNPIPISQGQSMPKFESQS